MKKRRKSTIKNRSKIIVVCLALFRDSGTKTTITGKQVRNTAETAQVLQLFSSH
jgi:hypothetical protein